jgi:hypothetical protein
MVDRNEMERQPEERPLAVENAALPESETISEFGEVEAKAREVAIESATDPESGGVAEQRAYLRWEARVDEEEREDRTD